MSNGIIDYQHLNGEQINGNNNRNKNESLLTDKQQEPQQQVEIDYEVERKMMLQKTDMINQVEQEAQKINEIINTMGVEVEEQGQNLDVISEELMKTNKNMTQANE